MKPNKTYIIQHKETKEMFIARSDKSSWKQPGHAKNAWNQSMFGDLISKYEGLDYIVEQPWWSEKPVQRTPYFSEQNVFEIVELKHEAHSKLDEAISLIKYLQGRCNYDAELEIVKFLEEIDNEKE